MEILKLFLLVIASLALIVLLKQYNLTFAVFATVFVSCAMLFFILSEFVPLVRTLEERLSITGQSEYIALIIKCIGVSMLSQFTQDICIDYGQASLATKTALAAKVTILVIAMPLFEKLLNILNELLL